MVFRFSRGAKMKTKFEVNEHVRILRIKNKEHPDAFGRVDSISKDGMYRVVNMNMPYMGSICEYFHEDELGKVI